ASPTRSFSSSSTISTFSCAISNLTIIQGFRHCLQPALLAGKEGVRVCRLFGGYGAAQARISREIRGGLSYEAILALLAAAGAAGVHSGGTERRPVSGRHPGQQPIRER